MLDQRIYLASFSTEQNQIYLCLLNNKKVLIFDYNLKEKNIKLNKNFIIDEIESDIHFNKCISISKAYLATADNSSIIIWKDDLNNINKYTKFKTITLNDNISDLLSINDECFISSQPRSRLITFYNINSLKQEKIIPDINIIDNKDSLLLFKEYTIINCRCGLALIFNGTKEYVQYIELKENNYGYNKKCISCDNYFYTVYSEIKEQDYNNYLFIKINGFKINEGNLEKCEDYKDIEIKVEDNIDNSFEILSFNKNCFLISNDIKFILYTFDNENELSLNSDDEEEENE